MTRVALLGGTGRIGPALALRLARAGETVTIGSRDAERATRTADELNARLEQAGGGSTIAGATNAAAAESAEIVFVTVPYEGQGRLLEELAPALADRIVVSTAIPMRFDPEAGPEHVEVGDGSAAEQVAAILRRSRVVGALHTVSNVHLGRLDRDLDEDVLVTGDDGAAKETVSGLLELIPGLRAVDAGRLANARYTEELTVLLLSINRRVRRSVGVRVTNLPPQ